jgi:hypothetical protein
MSVEPAFLSAARGGGEDLQLLFWQALKRLGFQVGSCAAGKWRPAAHSW